MSIELLNSDFEKASNLASLLTAHATGEDASSSDYKALRHELLSNSKVANLLPDWLKVYRNLDSFGSFIWKKFRTYADRRKFIAEELSPALNFLEFGPTVEMEKKPEVAPAPSTPGMFSQSPPAPKKKVFIVHGRDNEAKQEVSRYIESLNIDVIILHEQASSGMTIIEKIEHYAQDADFAIILYTACDLGHCIHETKVHPKNRARQNVVFEHGYLMAKLGRENVCALVKGEIETPNDINGVVYVDLDQAGAWKLEINKELKACGYKIP